MEDRLRGGNVVGAEVVHLESGARVTTDSAGRFEFPGISTGTIAYWAPWLDSLDLPALRTTLQPQHLAGTPALLATPWFDDYFRSRCGYPPEDGQGLLVGHAHETGTARVVVGASWSNLQLIGRSVEKHSLMALDSVEVGAPFSLCGVPTDGQVTIGASGAGAAGPIILDIRARVTAISLRLAAEGEVTDLRGKVRTPSGAAVAGAELTLIGDSGITRSNERGEFVILRVPRRSGSLAVRAVGYQETLHYIDPSPDDVTTLEIRLAPISAELAPMLVTAELFAREREEYERRRRGATGFFITDEMLKDVPQISSNTLAAMVPRLGTSRSAYGTRRTLQLRRGMGFCSPRFFENGIDLGRLNLAEQVPQQFDLIERAKRIEIYTASQAPPRFNDNDGCGAIVVWTR